MTFNETNNALPNNRLSDQMALVFPKDRVKTAIPVPHDFNVDNRTGFMAPRPPISRLPPSWEPWEATLDAAIAADMQLGDKVGLAEEEAAVSQAWRTTVRQLPVLSVTDLCNSPELLRRAHLVLAFLLHFYVQTIPPNEQINIPASISLPMLRVSSILDIPPLLTFSDTVLFNWDFRVRPDSEEVFPTGDNIRTQTMFTNSTDEEEFYLCSARIELRGVQVLELMRLTMDETFVGDDIAVRRITEFLYTIASVVGELKGLLLDVKKLCDPDIYYNRVRPWFRGEDSVEHGMQKRKWIFEGLEGDGDLSVPQELSGPSAGQSSMIHVLDIFLCVDHQATSPGRPSFMSRMQSYMPRNHRIFLDHLKANPRPLRDFVLQKDDAKLLEAYNQAVVALKEFRDAHMIIATLYILGPARRAAKLATEKGVISAPVDSELQRTGVKGTGGTDLVKFLKDTRTRTTETIIPH